MLMFAHGFSIHFGTVAPPAGVDVTMIAPKGPGHLVRRTYEQGIGTPGLVAVQQDATGKAEQRALAYGAGIGCARAGHHRDHLQGGDRDRPVRRAGGAVRRASSLIKNGFDTLVAAGYQPEIAYFECLHELKLIIDLIYEGGLSWMRYSRVRHGRVGRLPERAARGRRARARARCEQVLAEIQDGSFAKQWIAEADAGFPEFLRLRSRRSTSQLERWDGSCAR